MKYLKLFEAYSPNHFWSELDQSEWNDLMNFEKLYFTEEEVEEIRQLAVELAPDSTEAHSANEPGGKLCPYGWDVTRDYDGKISNIHFYVHNISYVTIYKIEDEWFGIVESWGMNQQTFYKCDQWNGLIETLKEIFENA
jgi:hypothetical protein